MICAFLCNIISLSIVSPSIPKKLEGKGENIFSEVYFIFKLIYFNWNLIILKYCSIFCHTLIWISHRCTYVPHTEPLSYLPPHPIPHPSPPALSALSQAWNLDWWSISHMVMYMFQCCSLKSSQPHFLQQTPKVCSLHLCLSCCLSYRVIITLSKFHIYVLIYSIGVFLSDLLHSV